MIILKSDISLLYHVIFNALEGKQKTHSRFVFQYKHHAFVVKLYTLVHESGNLHSLDEANFVLFEGNRVLEIYSYTPLLGNPLSL